MLILSLVSKPYNHLDHTILQKKKKNICLAKMIVVQKKNISFSQK